MTGNAKLRVWLRASRRHPIGRQMELANGSGAPPSAIYVASASMSIEDFIRQLRPGDAVLVPTLGRLATTWASLTASVEAIRAKKCNIIEMRTGRHLNRADDAWRMMAAAKDEIAVDRKTHTPEQAREYGSMGGRKVERTPEKQARGPWRDLSLSPDEAVAHADMAGWSVRSAYKRLGPRNTARGVRAGRPRKST